jgi:prophage regulatory protein
VQAVQANTPKIKRAPEVCADLKIGKSTLYAWVKDGSFSKPIKLGARAVGWLESDIAEFIENRAKARAEAAQ